MALESLSRGIFSAIGLLKNKRKLDENELKEMLKTLRRALQEADFNVRQTKEITERLETRLREEETRPGLTLQTHAWELRIGCPFLLGLLEPRSRWRTQLDEASTSVDQL